MTAPPPSPATPRRTHPWAWVVCVLLAGLLLIAAWSKWHPPYPLDLPQVRTIFDDAFPAGTLRRDAFVAVELATALWLVVGWRRRAALLWTALLMVAFSAVIGYELTRPDPRRCGCLPIDATTMEPIDVRSSLWQSLARNLFALLASGWAWLLLRPDGPVGPGEGGIPDDAAARTGR